MKCLMIASRAMLDRCSWSLNDRDARPFKRVRYFKGLRAGAFLVVVVSPNRLQGLKISGGASERRQEEITTCKRKAENRERLLTQYHEENMQSTG